MERLVLFVFALGSLYYFPPIFVRADDFLNLGDILNDTIDASTRTDMKVTFVLFNRNNPNGIRVAPNDTDQKLISAFIKNIAVIFITHGWLGSENVSSVVRIRQAYGRMFDYNVVSVGWSPISRFEYFITTIRVPQVGWVIGNMVTRLFRLELTTLDLLHLIGHSLGAHVMGVAGGFVRDSGYGKVARVTGLDPASPGYEQVRPTKTRLDDDDGQFVDVIHTSVGVFGYIEQLGHADFYPNGGYNNNQPGCTTSSIFCSHERSFEYYAESIYHGDAYPSVKCDSYENFQANRCNNSEIVYMGNPTPSSTRGKYYLRANLTVNNNRRLFSNIFK